MNSKKPIFVTAVVAIIATTAFYLTPLGESLYRNIRFVTGDMSFTDKIGMMDSLMEKYYIDEYDEEQMQDLALTGYAAGAEDIYTTYINEKNLSAMYESMGGDYQGIGVEVFINDLNQIEIVSVFENSPAQKSGLVPKDCIVAVEGEVADGSNYQSAINKIKGVNATEGDNDVVITVKRGAEIFDVTLVRETVSVNTVTSKMAANGIGYIQITDFGENTFQEYSRELLKLNKNDVRGLVIDLRNNPGGMLTSVVQIADTLLPEGNIVTIKDKAGNESPYNSDADYINLPTCIIVNEQSASASEVLTGAMRDHKCATIVGEKTYGKGVVQSLIEFGDGSAFKLTTAKYYTPSGECIDGVGIAPDVEVSLNEKWKNSSVSLIPDGEDTQLDAAIQAVKDKMAN